MNVHCYELLKIPSFKNIQLVAGKAGLDRKVSWVYVLQTPSLEDWVYGGELLFVINNDNICNVLEESVSHQLAGVVILKNKQNESILNDEIINYANKENLPLFEMDYRIKIIDITRDISTYIIHKQERTDYLNYFFYNILFSENIKKKDIDDFTLNFGIRSEHVFFIATLQCKDISKLNNIQTLLQMYVEGTDADFLIINLNSRLIILFYGLSECVNKAKKLLKSSFSMLNEKFPDLLFMGIGNTYATLYDIRYSYMKSMKSIDLCTNEKRVIDYEELGFQRLILNTIDEEELEEYARYILGKVKEYDEKHQTFFLKTMEAYVLYNGNINKTSAELYIHRNTCIYRITKINELFQIDLDNPYTRADILNCLSIYRFLDQLE